MKKKPSPSKKGRALSKKRAAKSHQLSPGLNAFATSIGVLFGKILVGAALDKSDQANAAPAAGQDPAITEDAEFEVVGSRLKQ